jgi:nitrate reductase beta subunit
MKLLLAINLLVDLPVVMVVQKVQQQQPCLVVVLYSGCNGNATFQSIAILYTGEFLAASIQLSGTPSFLACFCIALSCGSKNIKCTFCYPRIESGEPTVCSETCVGRIRNLGVILYDADRIEEMANISDEKDLYEAQLEIFLDPHDKAIQKQAKKDGVPDSWMEAAKNSPVYKMAIDWKVAFPLHPEYRTLPMVWYVPPLSPIQNAIEKGVIDHRDPIPNVEDLRIPVRYLANMLTAGNEEPIILALKRMIAMRNFMRGKKVDNAVLTEVLNEVGLTEDKVDDMYKTMALAAYEDRFVIPTNHKEYSGDTPFDNEIAFSNKSSCGFTFGNGCSEGATTATLFGGNTHKNTMSGKVP